MANKVCPYCKKPFEQGDALTSNENNEVVHLDCELEIELKAEREYLNRKGKKNRSPLRMFY